MSRATRLRPVRHPRSPSSALSANMSETATPRKFSVEGEQGLEDDERTGTSPRWTGDRGDGQGDPTEVYGGGQTEDRPGGRRVQDAGRGRGVVAARGVVLLASHDVARGAGARGTGRGAEEAGARAAGRRSPPQEARRGRTGGQPVAETGPTVGGAGPTSKKRCGAAGSAALPRRTRIAAVRPR